jgi:hypothetical protein
MQYFFVGLALALVIVFIFRKQLKARRDAMLRNIKDFFGKGAQK